MKWIKSWVATVPSPTHPDRNEDNLWVAASGRAAAVIDGMGGYRRRTAHGDVGGEHASSLASKILAERLDAWDGLLSMKEAKVVLRQVIEEINARLWQDLNWSGKVPPEENPDGKSVDETSVGAAMTLVAMCDAGTRAIAAQHGDTHGYALKDDMGLIQITEDQDLLTWERMNGVISEDDAVRIAQAIDHFDGVNLTEMMDQKVMRYFFDKNIFGALGVDGTCPETGWSAIKLVVGDRIALLSDGAYSNMSLDELSNMLSYPDDPAQVVIELSMQRCVLPRFPDANELSKPYNMRATQDDMTAVVLEVGVEDTMEGTTESQDDLALSAEQTTEAMPRPRFITEPLAAPNTLVESDEPTEVPYLDLPEDTEETAPPPPAEDIGEGMENMSGEL
ncbi:MAG: hypothetical protein H0T73_07970 [Ardenticatenales bacterium]|nr:hypothetical protein [Ardenticatenales bacterium]